MAEHVMRARRAVYFLSLLLFASCGGTAPAGKLVRQYGGPKTRPDTVSERYIVLSYPSGRERLSLTYYHNGNYDPAAMAAINRLFRDRHNDRIGEVDPELIDFLVDIRARLSLPPTVVFEILSGYRCPETNAALARNDNHVAKESLHIHGWAVDFRIAGVNGSAIAEIAKTMQRGGVSFYPKDNHVHVDLGNIRTWPTGARTH
jgi:uncharacterized protein YcbK (DUF882 family)